MSSLSNPYQDYIAYYVKSANTEQVIPAIFKRNTGHSRTARLFVVKGHQTTDNPNEAITIAQRDLTTALQVVLPIAKLAVDRGFLRLALSKEGYIWPGVEPVDIELVQESEQAGS